MGRVREEKREEKKERRSEKRKSQQKDLRVRVKVEKPRFTVFFPASLCRVLVYPHLVHPIAPPKSWAPRHFAWQA